MWRQQGKHDRFCVLLLLCLQWINSCSLVLLDSHEKLHVVDRPTQDVLETLDLEQVQLVYNSRHFKSLATGGNVSQALVRQTPVAMEMSVKGTGFYNFSTHNQYGKTFKFLFLLLSQPLKS